MRLADIGIPSLPEKWAGSIGLKTGCEVSKEDEWVISELEIDLIVLRNEDWSPREDNWEEIERVDGFRIFAFFQELF